MADDPLLDPDSDPFRPPTVPTEVHCIHCGREYDSYLIEWREFVGEGGRRTGFWCCPVEGCDGKGFGFDILPTDPEYIGEDGESVWCFDDDEGEDDEEWVGDDVDDLKGEGGAAWAPPDGSDEARRPPPPPRGGGDAAGPDADPDEDDEDIPW